MGRRDAGDGADSEPTAGTDAVPGDTGGTGDADGTLSPDADPDLDDAMDELEELEALVDSPEEREQVREAMRTLRRAQPRPFGRLRSAFGLRDIGEALVGSVLFGIPMIVEDGTLDAGAHIATRPFALAFTAVVGVGLVVGILRTVEFEKVQADLLFGVVPVRLLGLLGVAAVSAFVLLTVWGRVDWADPQVAAGQTLVTALVMAVGASLGDILPET